MRAGSDNFFMVEKPAQRKALTSPVRLEVLEHLRHAQPASVADVAERMGRSPDSLYYHFNLLRKVGLVVEAGARKAGKRDEQLYRLIADQIAMPCNPESKSSVASTLETIRAINRLSEREFAAALSNPSSITPAGPGRNLHARRIPARLSKNALAKINAHLDAIEEIAAEETRKAPNGRLDRSPFAITFILNAITDRRYDVD